MKIKNTTEWPDKFLRRLISWCCREIEFPVRYVRLARFGKSRIAWGGRAYLQQFRIGVRIGRPADFPTRARMPGRGGYNSPDSELIADPIEALVKTTAHELAHLEQFHRRTTTRRGNLGGSEHLTQHTAFSVLRAFRKRRETLLAEWNTVAEEKPEPEKPAAGRAAKAAADLERWLRKLKAAQNKVRKYRARVRYYERKTTAAATKSQD